MKINEKQNLKIRNNAPMSLASALTKVFTRLGGNVSDADLIMNWKNIIGEDMAKQIKIFKISSSKTNRTLTVKMISKSSALLMSYSEKKLLDKLNAYYGKKVISKIKFIN